MESEQKPEVQKAVDFIIKAVKSEVDLVFEAGKELKRCKAHVAQLESDVSTILPGLISDAKARLNQLIASGKKEGAKVIQEKLTALESELERSEKWLNKEADTFIAEAVKKCHKANNKLSQAVSRSCVGILDGLNVRADAAMAELFGCFEDWYEIKMGLSAEHLPVPLTPVPIHTGGFCATLNRTDRNTLLRFKKMTDVLAGDMARGKWQHQDKLFAKRKVEQDAADRIYTGNLNRSVSMKIRIFKENAGTKVSDAVLSEVAEDARAEYIAKNPRGAVKHKAEPSRNEAEGKQPERTWRDVEKDIQTVNKRN